jgi:Fic/DOC family
MRLVKEEACVAEALGRIAAFHCMQTDRPRPFRRVPVQAGGRFFCHPADVPLLCGLFFARLETLWVTSESVVDDLLVAAYVIYAVTAIHPFEGGNGRTAHDLANYLLTYRWSLQKPAFAFSQSAHRSSGSVFSRSEKLSDGKSAQGFFEVLRSLAYKLDVQHVDQLKAVPHFLAVSLWLARQATVTTPTLRLFVQHCETQRGA